MNKIQKAPETLSFKERVLRTFSFEKTDRVPIDYMANPGIHQRFCRALGMHPKDRKGLLCAIDGYQFSTTHMIQDNTPVENLFAMYQAAHTYGRYENT